MLFTNNDISIRRMINKYKASRSFLIYERHVCLKTREITFQGQTTATLNLSLWIQY